MYKLGVDLGGTKTEAILLDESLNVLERKRVSTPKNDYSEIIDTISNLVLDVSSNVSDFSLWHMYSWCNFKKNWIDKKQ